MNPIVQKTLGGLTKQYYFRQFFFGCLFLAFFVFISFSASNEASTAGIALSTWVWFVINTILYPYSRFVYETIVGFIMGENVLFGSIFLVMGVKLFTMLLCWFCAIFIAPIGLIYLYFHHTKQEKMLVE